MQCPRAVTGHSINPFPNHEHPSCSSPTLFRNVILIITQISFILLILQIVTSGNTLSRIIGDPQRAETPTHGWLSIILEIPSFIIGPVQPIRSFVQRSLSVCDVLSTPRFNELSHSMPWTAVMGIQRGEV